MKSIKMVKAILVILVLSILTGCSDSSDLIVSSGIPGTKDPLNNKISETQDSRQNVVPVIPTFRTMLKLKPHKSYTFNLSNTGFSKFTSIDIENLTSVNDLDGVSSSCGSLAIYGDIKTDVTLDCHSHSFDFKQITIENLSSKMIDLDVTLLGIRYKKVNNNEE